MSLCFGPAASVHALVEALLKPDIGRSTGQFGHRGQLFVGSDECKRWMLREIYELRSCTEHMNELDEVLAAYPEPQRQRIAFQRAFEVDISESS